MDFAAAFKIVNTLALLCWVVLLLMPRPEWLIKSLRFGVITLFAILYACVVLAYFGSIEGGGFDTLKGVQVLLGSDAGAFAGWVHYLAFDLFIGLWIAQTADQMRVHRVVQVPILIATFMLGPLGLLLFYLLLGWRFYSKPEKLS